jgi:hypothetical protein
MRTIIASMEAFMGIFKIEEVKDYVELKTENIMMRAQKYIMDNESLNKGIEEAVNRMFDQVKENYDKQMHDQQTEMTIVISKFLYNMPRDQRRGFIDKHLKENKRIFIDLVRKIEGIKKN